MYVYVCISLVERSKHTTSLYVSVLRTCFYRQSIVWHLKFNGLWYINLIIVFTEAYIYKTLWKAHILSNCINCALKMRTFASNSYRNEMDIGA